MSACHRLLSAITCFAFLMGPSSATEPPETNERVRTDAYGDPLPKGARFRLGTVRLRHDAPVTAIAWLPDGRTLASAGRDNTVRLWQISGGKQLARWDNIRNVAFSPNGHTFACGGEDGVIRFMNLANGEELRRIRVPKAHTTLEAFSPDGKILAAVEHDRGVHLYDAESGKELRVLEGKVLPTWNALAFAPDGRTLAVTAESCVCCWDSGTGKKLKSLGEGGTFSIAFAPDGKMLAAAVSDGLHVIVYLWSWPEGKELRRFDVKEDNPESIAFSPDGKLLAAGGYGKISLWVVGTGKTVRHLEGRSATTQCLAFSPDGSMLACVEDDRLTLWEVRAQREARPLTGVGHYLDTVAMTLDGRMLLTHALDGTLSLWDGREGRRLRTLTQWHGDTLALFLAPDGNRALLLPRLNHSPIWWDVATRRPLPDFSGLKKLVSSAAFSPDSATLALDGFDDSGGFIHLRETATGRELRQLREGKRVPNLSTLAFSPDGRTLASGHADGSLTLWDLITNQPRHRMIGLPHKRARSIAFAADGRLLTVSWDEERSIRLYEAVSGQEVSRFSEPEAPIETIALAPDARTLASTCYPTDENTHFSPSASRHTAIRLWDVPSGKQICLLEGHRESVHTLAFSSDGDTLVSGSYDDTVLAWDVAAVTRRRPVGKDLSAARVVSLWTDLALTDAVRAQRAVAELIQSPDVALPFLEQAVPPVPSARMAPIAALIADLDHEDFARRERASKELEKVGEPAAPALRNVLKEKPSLEVRKRIESLLEAIDGRPISPEGLRTLRALQVLESTGTPKARKILERLASGAAEAALTQEAKAALQRLSRRNINP